MKLEEIKIGLRVSFHKLKNGKVVGLEDEILTIERVNFKDWESCNVQLSNGVFTNHEAIEIVKEAKKPINQAYKQLSLFDFMEV